MFHIRLSIKIKMIIALGLVTVLALGTTFYLVAKQQETQIVQMVHARTKALFDHMILTRAWVSKHQGVYVKKLDGVETNPYLLEIPHLDVEIETVDGQIYTLRNPALLTRGVSKLGAEREENFALHIASLKPVNPENAPTKWEAQALRGFEQGVEETSIIEFENNIETFRYMAPLKVTASCLPCHQVQGYVIGDIRGGISVSVPFTEARAAITNTHWQLFFIGMGTTAAVLLILYASGSYLVLTPLQQIEETARKISQGQFDQRVPIDTHDELGSLARSLNQMTDQLHQALQSSEQLVAERTKRLETAATLSGHLNAILDSNQLLTELVSQIKDRFGYYHVHIYLLDESGENLIITAGAGVASTQMKTHSYSISLTNPQSMVARAARTKEVVIIDDVSKLSDDWRRQSHPLLMLTHSQSKIAVPVIAKEDVLGVLVVHKEQVAGLDEGDADLLRSLANHVAINLTNLRLFEQTQTNLVETENLYHISQRMMSAKTLSDLVSVVVEGVAIPVINRAILLVCDYNANEEIESLTLRASWYSGQGTPPRPLGTRYPWATPTVVYMALTPDPLFFNDVQEDDRVDPLTLAGAEKRDIRAMVVLPLLNQGRQMGVLMLLGEEKYHFTRQEIRPYYSLVGQLAVAVENQRLFEQTQQRAIELEEAHNFLDSIVENIPSMLFVKDARDLRFIRWNRAAEKLIGHKRDKVIDQTGYNFLSAEQTQQWLTQDQEVVAENKSIDIAESQIQTINQEERLIHTRKVPIAGARGEVKYLLGISEDITKRKQIEAALQQANKDLTKLNADKDKFFSIVAHDLRGPFSPLLGLSKFLLNMADKATPADIKELGGSIHRSAKNVYNLLENLLQWSRMQSGHMPYEPISLNLKEIIEPCITLLTINATEKEITLQSNLTVDLPVYADKNMLDTILRNLTTNALKFTPKGGQITISAQPGQDSLVEVSVSDTGIGISPENIAKLFKIEVNHTTQGTAKEQGTGLGLIICQEMVEQNGGKIWVESKLGLGTTVKFTIPYDSSFLDVSWVELKKMYQQSEKPPTKVRGLP